MEDASHDLQIPHNFSAITCYDNKSQRHKEPVHRINPQTTEFCARFGLLDINSKIQQLRAEWLEQKDGDEEELDSTGSTDEPSDSHTDISVLSTSVNPDEIILDEDSSDEDPDTCCTDPSPDVSAPFSDIRIMPNSMTVSPNDTVDFAGEEPEKSSDKNQTDEQSTSSENSLKRIGDKTEEGDSFTKRIKRRNQAIYASKDDEEEVQ